MIGSGDPARITPSPNIWHWPDVYERENRAQDVSGALWAALRASCDWSGGDVVDVGCGDGFHLGVFAESARSVVGVEPHPPLVERARSRVAGMPGVAVLQAPAQRLPLAGACADLVHARTAYFFGPGCEPGLVEAERVLRPGGTLAIVDLDGSCSPYGDWMRADSPRFDPVAVERFFQLHGFRSESVRAVWRFADRAELAAVLGIEFSPKVARRALRQISGCEFEVGYRVRIRTRPVGLLRGS
ncbi:class I SAM-dependent methyltransferase [Saccharopolyspora gregorii]|uniref:Class I SAM-dependent methyltransferase n=1 Tax=Saccharopolyspora gregorii TaxID=33914 RepID=A0ABP6RSM0_9PSEU|nr:class I SAM-dependent methyltransferase [Saccharopolyspora gregorii]